jgi:Protein of unknown function (DUF2911)
MRPAKKHPLLNGLSIRLAFSLSFLGIATFAYSQSSRCPKDEFGTGTDAGNVFEGLGVDLTIGYCAITTKAGESLGSSLINDNIWPGANVPAPVFMTKSEIAIGDLLIPAGKYSLYFLPSQNGWKLIVSRQDSAIGYDESKELGRVVMAAAPTSKIVADKLSIRMTPIHGKSCSGRCNSKHGPYLSAGEIGGLQIHFVWGSTDAYAIVGPAKNSNNAVSR